MPEAETAEMRYLVVLRDPFGVMVWTHFMSKKDLLDFMEKNIGYQLVLKNVIKEEEIRKCSQTAPEDRLLDALEAARVRGTGEIHLGRLDHELAKAGFALLRGNE